MSNPPVLPTAVTTGARIGVITVSAPAPCEWPDGYATGLERLRGLGFEVVEGSSALSRLGYRAGSEEALLHDLHTMAADQAIHAILLSGGGYNSNRLLRGLDIQRVTTWPKPIVGPPETGALLNAITAHTGMRTFQGPSVTWDLGDREVEQLTIDHFLAVLAGEEHGAHITSRLRWLRPGRARGHLIAGRLTSLRTLLGTPWQPDFRGAVLMWDEMFQPVDLIDQALTHLRDAGVLDVISGMVIGELIDCDGSLGWGVDRAISDICSQFAFPIATEFPCARPNRYTLPLGATVLLDSNTTAGLIIEPAWVTTTMTTDLNRLNAPPTASREPVSRRLRLLTSRQ